jgi:hypothetical protein
MKVLESTLKALSYQTKSEKSIEKNQVNSKAACKADYRVSPIL